MDDFSIHLDHLPRRFPLEARVAVIGHLAAKRDRVRHPFASINFSLVLAGSGDYRVRGVHHAVVAPAVLTQWPGEPMDYGPQPTWRELYLIYPAAALGRFASLGIFDPARPMWSVGSAGTFLAAAEELARTASAGDPAGTIDRIDRLAERVVVESLLAAAQPPAAGRERQVLAIREAVDRAPPGQVDPEAMARCDGLSQTHFRRLWERLVGVPPARYVAERRLREAARRLVEGTDTVAAIARGLGFSDPLYFSRRFRAFTGVSPGAYRSRYREAMRGPQRP